jgi:hypothetical protein
MFARPPKRQVIALALGIIELALFVSALVGLVLFRRRRAPESAPH